MLRPAAIAGDTATSEAAVLHAMDTHEALHGAAVDVVLLVQCTSPFLVREDVDGVAGAVAEDGADTAVTVAPFHGFVWRDGDDAAGGADGGHGVNHDKAYRPRRQDRPQDLLETGAAYAMAAPGFRKHQHRFFGRTELVRTDPARVLEIDDPHDLARARALAPHFDAARAGALPTAADIDAVVLDFDGTQTDDRVLIDSDGREFVSVHRGDGLGIAALRRSGLTMLILSTEVNPVVAARARKLNSGPGPRDLLFAPVSRSARHRLTPTPDRQVSVFSSMPIEEVPEGVTVAANDFAWTRARFGPPRITKGADMVGTSLVETGVVDADRYVAAVRALAGAHGAARYFAHRRESAEKLHRLAVETGLQIVRPDLPLELIARRGPIGRTVQLPLHRRPHPPAGPRRHRGPGRRLRHRPRLAHRVGLTAGPRLPERGHRLGPGRAPAVGGGGVGGRQRGRQARHTDGSGVAQPWRGMREGSK
ncbi:hypothetical protein STENM327S_00442 [Streptomyces tendae]